MSSAASRSPWRGRLFLGPGLSLYAGPIGPTSPHSHHSFQVVRSGVEPVHLGSSVADALACEVAVIPPDTVHVFTRGAPAALLLYVEPESHAGRRMRRLAPRSDEAAAWRRAGSPLRAISAIPLPATAAEAGKIMNLVMAVLIAEATPPAVMHPGIVRALRALPGLLEGDVRAASVAARCGLSVSRLTHLFGVEVGLTMRAYVRWLRLQRAAVALERGSSLTDAAHAAGFADSAHLTRSFKGTFGITPSELVSVAEIIELRPGSTR